MVEMPEIFNIFNKAVHFFFLEIFTLPYGHWTHWTWNPVCTIFQWMIFFALNVKKTFKKVAELFNFKCFHLSVGFSQKYTLNGERGKAKVNENMKQESRCVSYLQYECPWWACTCSISQASWRWWDSII